MEKTVMLTDEQYAALEKSGGDPAMLKKLMKLGDGEMVADWEKASTVYDGGESDEDVKGASHGEFLPNKQLSTPPTTQ